MNSPHGSASPSRSDDRPNVVFVLIDDLGWRDLGCYGSTFYETPHLDALAAAGALFTDAYAAAPLCSPTRASILSGKYPVSVGMTTIGGYHGTGRLRDVPSLPCLPNSEVSLARALRDSGYQTWHVGKWHLGDGPTAPGAHGFETVIAGSRVGMPTSHISPYGVPGLPDGPDGELLTDRLTTEAIGLLDQADPNRPFFLNLWHYAVHVPIEAPPELVAKYRAKAAELGLDELDPFEEGANFPVWRKRAQRIHRRTIQSDPKYAAMIENLDDNMGRLVAAIERIVDRPTLIIFTSDNGGLATAEGSPTSNLPLADGKGWTSEGGVREPLIISWPGVVAAGSVVNEPVTSPDFYPTVLSAARASTPAGQELDGKDFSAALQGQDFRRGAIFWHFPHYSPQGDSPSSAVRDGDWKLVRHYEDGREELYCVRTDLGEHDDRSADEPALLTRLAASLDAWLIATEARLPKPTTIAMPDDLVDRDEYYEPDGRYVRKRPEGMVPDLSPTPSTHAL